MFSTAVGIFKVSSQSSMSYVYKCLSAVMLKANSVTSRLTCLLPILYAVLYIRQLLVVNGRMSVKHCAFTAHCWQQRLKNSDYLLLLHV